MAIRFVCDCGRSIKARNERAGRRMRCPDCQAVLTIPDEPESGPTTSDAPEDDFEDLVPALWPQLAQALNPWVDRSLEQRATPWQRDDAQRRSAAVEEPSFSVATLAALVLLLLMVAGVGVAGWYYWPEGKERAAPIKQDVPAAANSADSHEPRP